MLEIIIESELKENFNATLCFIKYEYLAETMFRDSVVQQSRLNVLGLEGWECFHVSTDGQTFYLKRPKKNG